MKNASDKSCRETRNTHFMVHNFLFENHIIYEIMWKKTVGWRRPHITIWCIHIACWIPNTTNTHTGCIILIAFSLQQWLREPTSILHYTYTACLVLYDLVWMLSTHELCGE